MSDLLARKPLFLAVFAVMVAVTLFLWYGRSSRATSPECRAAEKNLREIVRREPGKADDDASQIADFRDQCEQRFSGKKARCLAKAGSRAESLRC